MTAQFLVYEHWRPDKGVCFYVGKGKRKRAHSFEKRNSRHGRIIAKLARNGLTPEVKIIADGLTEAESFAVEVERIAYWRGQGIEIANYTIGGDGTTGFRFTDAMKEKVRQAARKRKWSPETRAKMLLLMTGRKRSAQTKARLSASAKIAQKRRFEKVKMTKRGRLALSRRMMSMSRKAAIDPEVRRRRSENATALWSNPEYRLKVMAARATSACVSKPIMKGFS